MSATTFTVTNCPSCPFVITEWWPGAASPYTCNHPSESICYGMPEDSVHPLCPLRRGATVVTLSPELKK